MSEMSVWGRPRELAVGSQNDNIVTLFFTQVVSFRASPLFGALAALVGGLSEPAAPIVIPIAAAVVLAKWEYDVYKQSCVLRFLRMR